MSENRKIFNKEKQEKAVKWIDQKCPNLKCECCQQSAWSLAPDLVMPMPFTGSGNIVLGGNSYPLMQLICNTCGNTKIFNAIIMGLVDGKEEVKND